MAHKKIEVRLPEDIIDLFKPLYDCVDKHHSGGIIMAPFRAGYCQAVYFTADEFVQIRDLMTQLMADGGTDV